MDTCKSSLTPLLIHLCLTFERPAWTYSRGEQRTRRDQTLTLLAQRDRRAWHTPVWVGPSWTRFCLSCRRGICRCQCICSLTPLSSYSCSRICWHGKKNTFVWHTSPERTFHVESKNLNYRQNANALSGFSCQQPCCQWNLNVGKKCFYGLPDCLANDLGLFSLFVMQWFGYLFTMKNKN